MVKLNLKFISSKKVEQQRTCDNTIYIKF